MALQNAEIASFTLLAHFLAVMMLLYFPLFTFVKLSIKTTALLRFQN